MALVAKAEDVNDLADEDVMDQTDLFSFNKLLFVSSSNFDPDALSYAKKQKVKCFYFDGKKLIQKT